MEHTKRPRKPQSSARAPRGYKGSSLRLVTSDLDASEELPDVGRPSGLGYGGDGDDDGGDAHQASRYSAGAASYGGEPVRVRKVRRVGGARRHESGRATSGGDGDAGDAAGNADDDYDAERGRYVADAITNAYRGQSESRVRGADGAPGRSAKRKRAAVARRSSDDGEGDDRAPENAHISFDPSADLEALSQFDSSYGDADGDGYASAGSDGNDYEGDGARDSFGSGAGAGGVAPNPNKSNEAKILEAELKVLCLLKKRALPPPPPDADAETLEYYAAVDSMRAQLTLRQINEDGTKNPSATPDESRIRRNTEPEFSINDGHNVLNKDFEGLAFQPIPPPSERDATRNLGPCLDGDNFKAASLARGETDPPCVLCRCAAISNDGVELSAWKQLVDVYINSAMTVKPWVMAEQIANRFNQKTRRQCTQFLKNKLKLIDAHVTDEQLRMQEIPEVAKRQAHDHFKSHLCCHEVDCINAYRFLVEVQHQLQDNGVFRRSLRPPYTTLIQDHSLNTYFKVLAAKDALGRAMLVERFNSLRILRDAFVNKGK